MTSTDSLSTVAGTDGVHIIRFPPTALLGAKGLRPVRRYLSPLLTGGSAPRVVLDLDEVVLLTSEAIGMIVALGNALRPRGGRLHLAGISRQTRDVFEFSRLRGVVGIFPTTSDAIAGFG